jgi:hypothetical protein
MKRMTKSKNLLRLMKNIHLLRPIITQKVNQIIQVPKSIVQYSNRRLMVMQTKIQNLMHLKWIRRLK